MNEAWEDEPESGLQPPGCRTLWGSTESVSFDLTWGQRTCSPCWRAYQMWQPGKTLYVIVGTMENNQWSQQA